MQSALQQILYGVGEKSVFVQGAREFDIGQMVCEMNVPDIKGDEISCTRDRNNWLQGLQKVNTILM